MRVKRPEKISNSTCFIYSNPMNSKGGNRSKPKEFQLLVLILHNQILMHHRVGE